MREGESSSPTATHYSSQSRAETSYNSMIRDLFLNDISFLTGSI